MLKELDGEKKRLEIVLAMRKVFDAVWFEKVKSVR